MRSVLRGESNPQYIFHMKKVLPQDIGYKENSVKTDGDLRPIWWLHAWSTVDRKVASSDLPRAGAFRLSPQWSMTEYSKALASPGVSVRLGIYKIPCHLSKRVGHRVPVVGFLLVSFIN